MKILVNKAHYPVTVLGFGKRIGIWLQGCSIHCPSCCSRDTWEFDQDRCMDVASLIDWCREVSVDSFDGVTISGGEPFDQPDALFALLEGLCKWRNEIKIPFDILLYSGYSKRILSADFAKHLPNIDALVAAPFRSSSGDKKSYAGSDNQEMIVFSELGEKRYGVSGLENWKTGMQVNTDSEGIWMVGIPRRKELEQFEAACTKRGLILEKPSWRC